MYCTSGLMQLRNTTEVDINNEEIITKKCWYVSGIFIRAFVFNPING